MKHAMMYPLIGINVFVALCIAFTLWASPTDSFDSDEEVRQTLLEITCQEYYNAESEAERIFLSMIIRDIVALENISDLTPEEHKQLLETLYRGLIGQLDELVLIKRTHEPT